VHEIWDFVTTKGAIKWPTEPNREIINAPEGIHLHSGDILWSPTGFGSVKKLQKFIICDFWHVRDKPVQVKLINKSSRAIKSSCIDMNQSMIERLDNMLSYADIIIATVLLVHKL
jgi:hypothetical protein